VVSEEMIKMKNVEGQRMDGRLAMTIAHMAFGQASLSSMAATITEKCVGFARLFPMQNVLLF
jgi:hypothetical protein